MRDGRRSERLLYGTSLRFRLAGRGNEDVGYVYNISEGGLYVRTLAPPARWDELWIEFTPPRSDRLVHLDATCVWARKYGPAGTASVPPGFGVEITGGSKADLGRYERCYASYQEERQASRESILPPGLDLPPVVIPR
jgi:Tfp pilus assembly protein PilZ